jgi:hypothetical protein
MKDVLSVLMVGFSCLMLLPGCRPVRPEPTDMPRPEAGATSAPPRVPSSTLTPLPTFVLPSTSIPGSLPVGIFDPFPETFHDNTIRRTFGVVSQGATVEEDILVDATIGQVWFSLSWGEGDLNLVLLPPEGSVIDAEAAEADRNVDFVRDSAHEEYWILAPQPGRWKARISGKSALPAGSNYMLEAWASVSTRISVNFDREEYSAGDVIHLSASIENNISAVSIGPEYIHGVRMRVTGQDPAGSQHWFHLYDDGLHGDGRADDGVYANSFSDTALPGKYDFFLEMSGVSHVLETPGGPQSSPFTRIWFCSTIIR